MMISVLKLSMYYCVTRLIFVSIINGDSQNTSCEAQQSSTNGSFFAMNACDDDMETYSLTMDGTNQSWSMTLDKYHPIFWIFLRISCGKYDINIQPETSKLQNCSQIERMCNATNQNEVVTCDSADYRARGNRIIITKIDDGAMQIHEVKLIDFETLKEVPVKHKSGGLKGNDALDGNLDTSFISVEKNNATWYMTIDKLYEIKWILILLRGGHYDIRISTENLVASNATLCQTLHLHNPAKTYQILVECDREMKGNTVIIRRTDEGPMRLFEVHPIICPKKHYGVNCAKCRKRCVSCHPISGVCKQCSGSFFGDYCQHQCPTICLNSTCDQLTGRCNRCREGYRGNYCELQMSTTYNKTEVVTISTNFNWSKPSTVEMEMNALKELREDDEDPIQFTVLLVTLIAFVVVLLLATSIIFVLKWNKLNSKINKESSYPVDLQRAESRNDSELEEIPQNEADYAEQEETVTVEYCNLMSRRVSLEQFLRELPEKKRNGILVKEFDDLPHGLLESYSNALMTSKRKGNRYKGIYPYDYNRVKLVRADANEGNDFVNASYIHGFNRERTYIAAQGPFNPKTLEDFWTMVWQNDSTRIAMLTNLYEGDKMKCLKYWPDTKLDVGPYTIRLDTVDVHDSYILRYMVVQHQKEEKRVTQFHFTTWPDNSVPGDLVSLICFRNLVRNGFAISDGPIVVHCSAGIGRTGTFIALDYLLEESAVEETIDVKGYVASLRHQRGKSVQTCEQYLFLHDALIEGLTNNSVHKSILSVL